jgi:hypothetical protein
MCDRDMVFLTDFLQTCGPVTTSQYLRWIILILRCTSRLNNFFWSERVVCSFTASEQFADKGGEPSYTKKLARYGGTHINFNTFQLKLNCIEPRGGLPYCYTNLLEER